MAMALI
jgi:hypothetical protein